MNEQLDPSQDSPRPTTVLGCARDKLAQRTAQTSHEGRCFIITSKPLSSIDYLEECDLKELAIHVELVYKLVGIRPPTMEETLDAWVSEVEGHLADQGNIQHKHSLTGKESGASQSMPRRATPK